MMVNALPSPIGGGSSVSEPEVTCPFASSPVDSSSNVLELTDDASRGVSSEVNSSCADPVPLLDAPFSAGLPLWRLGDFVPLDAITARDLIVDTVSE